MQRTASTAIHVTLALATSFGLVSCKKDKKKEGDPAAANDGSGNAGAGGTAGSSAGSGDTSASAAGGALAGLKAETACPPSLGGNDKGLSRTIKKECGVVPVTEDYNIDGGELILEAGAQLAFAPGVEMRVGYHQAGKLIVKGTAAEPAVMTAAGDKAAGSWRGVLLAKQATRSSLVGLVLEFAGSEDEGALRVDTEDVVVKDSTFRDLKGIGLQVIDQGTVTDVNGNTFERAGTLAVSLPPDTVGALGVNTFKDGFVQVRGGAVERDATWKHPGTYYQVAALVTVDGKNARATLIVEAGVELRMSHEAGIRVGYHKAGALKIAGTKDKPVLFKGAEGSEPGSWLGLHVHDNGELAVDGAVIEHGGGDGEMGAIAASRGTLSVKDTVLRGNSTALTDDEAAKIKSIDGISFEGNTLAARLHPSHVGALGAANTYSAGQRIEITNGVSDKDATWSLQPGAEIHVKGVLDVAQSTLTLQPGVELRFDGSQLRVGYHHKANLQVRGTADKPVVLRGVRDEAGAWGGLELHANVDSSVLEHLVIADVASDAAITLVREARVDLRHVTIKRSKAGVAWDCLSKITTADIKIEGGGKAEAKPDKC